MKLARFEAGNSVSYGVVTEDRVKRLSGDPFEGARPEGGEFPLSSVRLLAPCRPSKIFALAFNFHDHLGQRPVPKEPQIFLKVPSSVIGPGDPIVLPRGEGGRMDEEAEVVVVMGRRCRNVKRGDALRYVFGYTCGNDVSARGWQKDDLNWWRAKSTDTFAPIGPFIVTEFDPADARITAWINGKKAQESTTAKIIFDIPSLIEWISAWVTLEPGDLIFTGTPHIPAEIKPGDVVDVDIEGIGVLSNPVI
jgi:2-keto-4-pentenoate hydratase/2-oxohepta-3-ene-1,7-dioic acid hydratase in catechol pathway